MYTFHIGPGSEKRFKLTVYKDGKLFTTLEADELDTLLDVVDGYIHKSAN